MSIFSCLTERKRQVSGSKAKQVGITVNMQPSFTRRVIAFCTLLTLCPTLSWSVVPKLSSEELSRHVQADSRDASESSLIAKAQNHGKVRVIVKFKAKGLKSEQLGTPQGLADRRSIIANGQNEVLQWLTDTNIGHVKRFKYTPAVAMEIDADALAILTANDDYAIQEDIPVPPTLDDSVSLINANEVWDMGEDGHGQAIAILDSGVDKSHEFLDGGTVVSEACYSTTSEANDSSTVCPNGLEAQEGEGAGIHCSVSRCDHGTHVAGIAAGRDSSSGFDGVAKGASLIAIQVFSRFNGDEESPNSNCTRYNLSSPCILSYLSDQEQALERVYELRDSFNIASVNMSLGGGYQNSACDLDSRKSFIDNLRSVQIVTVVSSGNDGYTDGLGTPACISSAISVGNTTKQDDVWNSSNSASFLDLLAPGRLIRSSVPTSSTSYVAKTGTSMAAPHVAGAFAMLKAANETATVDELLQVLNDTGVEVTDSRNDIVKPRIDVKAAYDKVVTPPFLEKPQNGCSQYYWQDGKKKCGWSFVKAPPVTFVGRPAAIGESQAPLNHYLYVGSQRGGNNHFRGVMSNRSVTVNDLPTSGKIHVRYWTRFSSGWKYQDHTYRMSIYGVIFLKPVLVPKDNSILVPEKYEHMVPNPLEVDPEVRDKLPTIPDIFCDPRNCDPLPQNQLKVN